MRQGRISYIESLAVELKNSGIKSIAVAYMENTGLCTKDGRFKYQFNNLNNEELSYLEKVFHTI